MKKALTEHVRQVFEALKIYAEYTVYNSTNDNLPEWLRYTKLTHEFVVCCEPTFEKVILQDFIHKDIFVLENHYFWFEGDTLKCNNHSLEIAETHSAQSKVILKTTTRLSSWLDNLIFNTLYAEYAPDFQKFEYNLNLEHNDNLKYLGTYFPRSYAETFCIFDNIFSNEVVKSKYAILKEISILSIGCGTGGDIIGLLTVINKHFISIKKVEVVAVDGNEDALNILSFVIQQLKQQFNKEVNLTTKQIIFDKITAIDTISSFDFIITSKMINEVIKIGKGRLNNSYYDFAKAYSPMLKDFGIMMILDVTTKDEMSDFYPILLNRQINQFTNKYPNYISIIPIPCSERENCQERCFSQKEFSITHSKFVEDKSRVAYRILLKKAFSLELKLCCQDTQYQIQPDRSCGQGSIVADGFYLPNTLKKNVVTIGHSTPSKTNVRKSSDNATMQEIPISEEIGCSQHKQLNEAYIIDTNAFFYAPNIIEKIGEKHPIFVSTKVVDELDHLKDVASGNDKKKVQKALKSINMALSDGRVQTVTSDARLLPADFNRHSPDNLILSVALKLRKMGYSPILVTSDNGFQIKAKSLKINTISYTKLKTKN